MIIYPSESDTGKTNIFQNQNTWESFYEDAIWIKGESRSSKPDVISMHNFIITLQTANLYNITAGP